MINVKGLIATTGILAWFSWTFCPRQ